MFQEMTICISFLIEHVKNKHQPSFLLNPEPEEGIVDQK